MTRCSQGTSRHVQLSFNGHECYKKNSDRNEVNGSASADCVYCNVLYQKTGCFKQQSVCGIERLSNEPGTQIGERQPTQKNMEWCSHKLLLPNYRQNQRISSYCYRR